VEACLKYGINPKNFADAKLGASVPGGDGQMIDSAQVGTGPLLPPPPFLAMHARLPR